MFQFSRKQKTIEGFQERQIKRCSDGSFEILDFEEATFQGHPSDFLDSHVMEKVKLMSRENSNEDYIMVVRNDSSMSSGLMSVCDSLSTLTISTESCPSVSSSVSSVEDAWDRQERAPPPSDLPTSPGQSCWAGSRVSSDSSRESRESGSVGCGALQRQYTTEVECCGESEKDGVFEHSRNSCTKTDNTKKTLCNGVTNLKNNFHFYPPTTCHTFPRQSQCSSSSSFYSHVSQAGALRLTKSNSPVRPGESSAAASRLSGKKKRCAHSEGSSLPARGGCDRKTGAGTVYMKKPLDVNRALSEPNEKMLVDLTQLLEVQPLEWLLQPSQPSQCVESQNTTDMREVSSSPELQHVQQDDRRPPTEEAIKKCIEKHSADFLQYTNWKCLFPYLMSNQLLDQCAREILINEMTTSMDKGIRFYYEVLPSKGKTAYSRYYLSVTQEREHIGHQTLVELLDEFSGTL